MKRVMLMLAFLVGSFCLGVVGTPGKAHAIGIMACAATGWMGAQCHHMCGLAGGSIERGQCVIVLESFAPNFNTY